MALEVKPSQEEVRVLLESGYLLVERRQYDAAKEVFEGVEAMGRGADVAQMGLATLHTIQGNVKEAEKLLKAAVKANPKNAFAHAQLGELYHTMGKKEEALAALKLAEEADPSGPLGGAFARAVREAVEGGHAYRYQVPPDAKAAAAKKK
jgi:tetratricopeptide (TPR) repeat protein